MFFFKRLVSKTFLKDTTTSFFAVTRISDVPQIMFLAKANSSYPTSHVNNMLFTCIVHNHTKLNCQYFNRFIDFISIVIATMALFKRF